ncbi:protein kinase [Nocardioides sp. BP30]|uniref:protein kinase domain-containing protein n=1 Tax=Nocardioides sp. BP30 TaxID=3036374 RepID=UPI00246996FB|nr:protein kinase [Nocardioides sp. BP30]WGL52578.1 protein kinase [Nocardioides sp. BP30]
MTTGPISNQPSPGRYVFGDLIATGGMGEVYRATDTALDRPVAIKLLKPEYADDPINRARFDSEARHAAALHHPHVAAVYDVGEMPTATGLMRPYLVMELVDGQPLSTLLRDGRPLDPEAVRDLLGQAGDALAAAHRAGIVHRDVKPANILVTPDREVKVTDFGIARAASSSAITGTGQVMGTPQYLSPEQARGEQATPASDVYSLGVMAFECLAGRRPFQKDTAVATALAHLHDPVPPLPASVPADLAAVVTRALAKDPKDRYPDAAAFTAALRGIDGGRTDTPASGVPIVPSATSVLPPSAGAPATETTVVGLGAATPLGAEEDQEGQRNWLNVALLAFLVLALVAVAIVAWLVLRGNNSPAPDNEVPSEVPSTSAPASSAPASPSASPSTITLEESAYTGRNIDDVLNQLRALGLQPKPVQRTNDGSEQADTVISVSPTTGLQQGDSVTVAYYGQAPRASATPKPTPTPTHAPTRSATPTPTPTPTPSATPTEATTTSAVDTAAPSTSQNTPGAS